MSEFICIYEYRIEELQAQVDGAMAAADDETAVLQAQSQRVEAW